MIIALGTTSTDKFNYLDQSLKKHGLYWSIKPVQAASGIADQPLSAEQTTQGAINRAKAALAVNPQADLGLGMEAGLEKIGKIYNLVCVAAVWNGQQIIIGQSNFTPLPVSVSQGIERGEQFGQLIRRYQLTAKKDELERVGQLVSRQRSFEQAITDIIPQLKKIQALDIVSATRSVLSFTTIFRGAWWGTIVLYSTYFIGLALAQVYAATPNAQSIFSLLVLLLLLAQPVLILAMYLTARLTQAGSSWPLSPASLLAGISIVILICQLPGLLATITHDYTTWSNYQQSFSVSYLVYSLYAMLILLVVYLLRHFMKQGLLNWWLPGLGLIGLFYAQVALLTDSQYYTIFSDLVRLTILVGLSLPFTAWSIYSNARQRYDL